MSRITHDLASSPHNAIGAEKASSEQSQPGMNRLRIRKLPRVAIIGAGVSGLRCANVLASSGAQVTIFEARNRIGGRVHQVDNGGYLIDTGSNWIHGTEGNPIMTLAEETKTVVMEPEENSSLVIDRDGKQRSATESNMLSEEFWEVIMAAFKYSDEHSAETDPKTSLAEWIEKEWKKKFKDHAKIQDLVAESKLWGQFVGSPIEFQSLKFFFLEEGLEGGNVFVAGTYQKILNEIARPALEKTEVRLSTEVNHIQYRSDDTDDPVKLQTTKGDSFEFDEAVVTCPLGWLKNNHKEVFSPSLPPRLTKAIESIGYGALEKLYISFPSAFWLGENHNLNNWPCFTNFNSPLYHPVPSSRSSTSWNQSVLSLAHLPGHTEHPTLLFYMTGDSGAYITDQARHHKTHSDSYNALLKAFAEPFYSRLACYDASAPQCQPTSFYLTSWQTDRHAGYGSYSTFRTGLTEGDKDIEVMRDAGGLGDSGRGLWMAGEHTAPFVALGTTTGAWWSGEGVARRIAKQYGLQIAEDRFSKGQGEDKVDESGSDGRVMKQPDQKSVL